MVRWQRPQAKALLGQPRLRLRRKALHRHHIRQIVLSQEAGNTSNIAYVSFCDP